MTSTRARAVSVRIRLADRRQVRARVDSSKRNNKNLQRSYQKFFVKPSRGKACTVKLQSKSYQKVNKKTDKTLHFKDKNIMATKTKTTPEALKNKRIIQIWQTEDEDGDEAASKTQLSPEVTAALNIQEWSQGQTVSGIRAALTEQINEVNKGNMGRPEAMLVAQAHTLDVLFNSLAELAHLKAHNTESFLRLAFKAQSQCRATLETLAAIKNPPVIYAKQANISNGPQQINNGVPAPAPQAEKIKNQPNELLEAQHGSTTLDSRTTGATIGKDKAMATVG